MFKITFLGSLKSLLYVFPLCVVVYNRSKDSGFNLDTKMDSLALPTFTETMLKGLIFIQFIMEKEMQMQGNQDTGFMSETRTPLVWKTALKRLLLGSRKRHGHEQDKSVPGTEENLGPACLSAEEG